ncbi:MAG: DUF2922 domain-containing protein [Defluviitaleaceae bacterium]|nr:DUF2922 domain-containing protein [Defluviitaleaceae bacterium]
MSVRNNAILTFNSNIGEVVRLTIPRADMTLTEPEARSTMEDMIIGGIVMTANGIPTAIRSAELVTTSRTPLMPSA